jgi:glycosyltransferase involved in cell wall biosynthesis
VGTAGVLLDPADVAAWADTIERLTTDAQWTRTLASAGLERARAFTWQRSADELHRAYLDAVRRRRER